MPSPLGRMALEDAHVPVLKPVTVYYMATRWTLLEGIVDIIRMRPGFRPQSLCRQNCRPLQEAEQCPGRVLGGQSSQHMLAALWVKEPQSQDSR